MSSGFHWSDIAVLIGRIIFAGLFLMALTFKFKDINGTAAYIASAGFPLPLFLAGLLFAAAHGPGRYLALKYGVLKRGVP